MIRGWVFNHLGNLCYRLNGGLESLNNNSLLDKLALWAWSLAYGYYDKQTEKRRQCCEEG